MKATTALSALNPINSKSLRTSTQLKKEATEKRKKQAERSRRTHQRVEHREWTQAELLAEAKQTEQSNLASLARYEKLELEKARKNKSSKLKEIAGPYIRYRSLSMPIIDPTELNTKPNLTEEKIDTPNVTKNRYERTLIMFSDVELFEQYFSKQRSDAPRKPSPSICPITKLPARYFDSVTRLPYANSFAFRTLRQAYVKQLQLIEPTGRSDELNRFLNWYNLQNNRENIQTPDVIPIETDQTAVDLGQSAVDKEQQTTEVAWFDHFFQLFSHNLSSV